MLTAVGSTVGGDQDDQAIIPATTYANVVSPSSGTNVSTIYLQATGAGLPVRRLPGGE